MKLPALFVALLSLNTTNSFLVGNTAPIQISLTSEEQATFHIQTAQPEPSAIKHSLRLYGKVVEPAQLVHQIRAHEAAQFELKAAQQAVERVRKLRLEDQLASQKDLDAAELQYQLSLKTLNETEDALWLEWGPLGGNFLKNNNTSNWGEQLRTGLFRVIHLNLPLAQSMPQTTASTVIWKLGETTQTVTATESFPAPVNNRFSAPGVFVLIDGVHNWASGQSVVAELTNEATQATGWKIPSAAVLYTDGAAWVYQQSQSGEYERKLISTRYPDAETWIVAADGIDGKQPIVVEGAQSLLAKETLSRSSGGASD